MFDEFLIDIICNLKIPQIRIREIILSFIFLFLKDL